ncbi:serine/threonine-protein kinase [Streptomyces sp. NPDC058045]|uniref:serine/threonine-protein kinase n=1 Tax=Streptomyces sp. NPDC058045 TaxID=3346311 RepID=UPI0036EB424F
MRLRAGDPEQIGGYPLESRLGAGGMGTVYLARTESGRPVAVKLIHQQFADDEEFRIRFRQEVAAARRVSGAFTAAVVDADPEGEHPWMATAYIPGPTLTQRIADQGTLAGPELRGLAIGLAEALRDIHRVGVVHRDLKPSNVVLSPEGPRVIDFGISRAADHQTLTMTGRVIGTPPFMSPEQLQAPREVGPESDVFSLATLLVYAATGRGPFDADSPYMTAYQVVHGAPVLGAVPGPLRAVVEPCLAKTRGERPSTHELLVRLRDLPSELAAPEGARCITSETDTSSFKGPPTDTSAGPDTDTSTGFGTGFGREPVPGPAARTASGADPGAEPDGTSAPEADPESESESGTRTRTPAASRRAPRRRRWRTAVVGAAAVVAVSTGVAFALVNGGSGDGDGKGGAVAAAEVALPEGFAPWRIAVRGGKGIPDELRCVAPAAGGSGGSAGSTISGPGSGTTAGARPGDSVYCGGGGVLGVRLRASDGKQVWKRTSPGIPVQGVHFIGVSGKAVLGYRIPAGGAPGQEIVALSAADGHEVWSAPVDSRTAVFTGHSHDAALLGGTVVSVDPARTRIVARDAESGRTVWTRTFPAGTECLPFVAGHRFYSMCVPASEAEAAAVRTAHFATLDPRTGEPGRTVTVGGHVVPVGEAGGSLVLLREHPDGVSYDGFDRVIRLDPVTGRTRQVPVERHSDSVPGMAGGTLYFAGADGRITAVDPASGKPRWARLTPVENPCAPVLDRGTLYVSSASGRVSALEAGSGRLLWSSDPRSGKVSGGDTASPRVTVAGGALVVAAGDNVLFTLDTAHPQAG